MKRTIVLAGLVAAAAFTPASPAQADHLCVTSNGQNVVCAPHLEEFIAQICVTISGRPFVCVP